MRTLNVTKGTPVFLSGYNGSVDPWDDMDGTVASVRESDATVVVDWSHPAMAHDRLLRYGAEKFVETQDRNGNAVLLLDLPVG